MDPMTAAGSSLCREGGDALLLRPGRPVGDDGPALERAYLFPGPVSPWHPEAMFQGVARLVPHLTGARGASLLLLEDESGRLRIVAAYGTTVPSGLSPASDAAGEVLRTGRPLLIRDPAEASLPIHPERGRAAPSCMAAPVAWEGSLYGVLWAADPARGSAFTSFDLTTLQLLAEHLGACIHALAAAQVQASVDSLTGAFTRRVLQERLAVEAERSRRFGHPVSLVLLDVDNMKRLNERHGQRTGDRVLQRIARILLETVRRVDLVARFGADEFAVLLPETGPAESLIAARRMKLQLHESALPGERALRLATRVSVGIATLPPAGSGEELLEQASRAMDQARGDREGLRHWELGTGVPGPQPRSCTCRSCGKTFVVETIAQQRARRYCSNRCAAEARRRLKEERNLAIQELREKGLSFRAIGEQFGISEERARQVWRDR